MDKIESGIGINSLPDVIQQFNRSNTRKGRIGERALKENLEDTFGKQNVRGHCIEDGKAGAGPDYLLRKGCNWDAVEVKFWHKTGDHSIRKSSFEGQVLARFNPIRKLVHNCFLVVVGRLPKNRYRFKRWCSEGQIHLIHLSIPDSELGLISNEIVSSNSEEFEKLLPQLAKQLANRFRAELTRQLMRGVRTNNLIRTSLISLFPISDSNPRNTAGNKSSGIVQRQSATRWKLKVAARLRKWLNLAWGHSEASASDPTSDRLDWCIQGEHGERAILSLDDPLTKETMRKYVFDHEIELARKAIQVQFESWRRIIDRNSHGQGGLND